jgi:hypothetical protein
MDYHIIVAQDVNDDGLWIYVSQRPEGFQTAQYNALQHWFGSADQDTKDEVRIAYHCTSDTEITNATLPEFQDFD